MCSFFYPYLHIIAAVSQRYQVSKYPTLKLIRNGVPVKKEYRGARTSEAFLDYIRKQLENPLKEFTSLQELVDLDVRSPPIFRLSLCSLKSICLMTIEFAAREQADLHWVHDE
jgi:hypothetical protein